MKITTLFEFERPVNQNRFFPFSAGVWGMSPRAKYDGILYDILQPEKINEVIFFSLFGVIVDGQTLIEKSTYAELLPQSATWFFDTDDLMLYIHFPNGNTPYSYAPDSIILQAFTGYYKSNAMKELELFGGYYEPRLKTFPVFRDQMDDYDLGRQAQAGGTVILENTDGALNNFAFGKDVLPKIGWFGQIRQAITEGDPTINDFVKVTQGFASKIQEQSKIGNGFGLSITLKDMRASFDKDVPLNKLDPNTWTTLSDRQISDPPFIPKVYGQVSMMPCLCLNPSATPGSNYKFMIGDATDYNITSIDKIYISNVQKTVSPTPTIQYTIQTDGKKVAWFEIPTSFFIVTTDPVAPAYDYRGMDSVSIDCVGYSKKNALDVTKELILDTYGLPYTVDNYDITQWDLITLTAPDIGLYINTPQPINVIITSIQKSFPYTSFVINADRKYTWFDYRFNDASVDFEIKSDAFPVGFLPSPDVNAETIGAVIQLNYDKQLSNNIYTELKDVSNVDVALEQYNTDRVYPPDYNTLLTDTVQATSMLERLSEINKYPETFLQITIPAQYKYRDKKAYELKAGDMIKILANSDNKIIYGYLAGWVHEIKLNIDSFLVDLTIKIVYNSEYTYKHPAIIMTPFNNSVLGLGSFLIRGIV